MSELTASARLRSGCWTATARDRFAQTSQPHSICPAALGVLARPALVLPDGGAVLTASARLRSGCWSAPHAARAASLTASQHLPGCARGVGLDGKFCRDGKPGLTASARLRSGCWRAGSERGSVLGGLTASARLRSGCWASIDAGHEVHVDQLTASARLRSGCWNPAPARPGIEDRTDLTASARLRSGCWRALQALQRYSYGLTASARLRSGCWPILSSTPGDVATASQHLPGCARGVGPVMDWRLFPRLCRQVFEGSFCGSSAPASSPCSAVGRG